MSIREILSQRKNRPLIESVTVADIGEVKVRRVTAGEAIGFETALHAVAASIVDEESRPLFATVQDVQAADWGLVQKLIDAYFQVNRIDVAAAAKN